MIKYAVMTFMYNKWCDGGDGSHEELIKILAEAGADGVEAFCNHFMESDELLKTYQKGLPDAGLAMPVMDLIANLAASDKTARTEIYDVMRRGIDICDALNSDIVHVAGCKLKEGTTPEDGKRLIAEGLMDFVDEVEKRGMTLAIENFNPSPTLICSANDCLDIIRQTDYRAKFVFDTGNFIAVEERAEDNFAKMVEHTTHFHFKDFQPADNANGYEGAFFGQGVIKNQQVARMARDAGYSGWVALESYPQDGNGPRETVAPELKVLKSYFGE